MTRLRNPHRARRSSPVKVTKPDGSVSFETARSPKEMGELAEAEEKAKERKRKRRKRQ